MCGVGFHTTGSPRRAPKVIYTANNTIAAYTANTHIHTHTHTHKEKEMLQANQITNIID